MAGSSDGDPELFIGHEGVGDDCIGKVIDKTGKFFLAGEKEFSELVLRGLVGTSVLVPTLRWSDWFR